MPFITQGETNWKFLLIVVVLAVIVGGGALWYEKRPEQQYQPVEIKKSEIANWETYRNDEYGFEIKYPKDWQVEVSAVKSIKIKNLISGSYFEIIENKNENNLTLNEWFKELTIIDGRPTLKASAKETSINGVKAYKLNSELEPPNPLFEIVGIADTQKRIFTLYAYSRQLDDNIILEKMLSTFKFIKGFETADWQTYRNEEYGFEFKYPGIFDRFENCKLIENDNTVAVGSRFAISILDAKELNLLEYVAKVKEESLREQVSPPPEEAWHQEDIYVGGIKGIKVVWFHGSRYSQMIYLSKDNRIFDIGFTAGTLCLDYYVEQGSLDEVHELDIFEQIPNTFKFLD